MRTTIATVLRVCLHVNGTGIYRDVLENFQHLLQSNSAAAAIALGLVNYSSMRNCRRRTPLICNFGTSQFAFSVQKDQIILNLQKLRNFEQELGMVTVDDLWMPPG